MRLDQDITYIYGVGEARAELFKQQLDIHSAGDLLEYYPYKHIDRSRIIKINEINGTMPYVQLKGEIMSFEQIGEGRKARLIAHFTDGTGWLDLVWFQGIKYAARTYDTHRPYIVFGKPQAFGNRYNIAHPEIEDARKQESEDTQHKQPLFRPSYNTTELMKKRGLSSAAISKIISNIFSLLDKPLDETLPKAIIQSKGLCSLDEAIHNIHFPQSADALRKAEARLKFEELFFSQLNILKYTKDRGKKHKGILLNKIGASFNNFFHHHLPFELTNAQKRVIREVHNDLKSGKQMNRLLQGDVGSGKTLVAMMCCLIAIDNGHQACIMAPTEILAEQHVETIRSFLKGMDINVQLLTGSIKGKRRKALLEDLAQGNIDILIGTHAIIEDPVIFYKLGFVVIDEQHRFGVAQRAKLWGKSNLVPHVLVMTATPIPRTLAMTLYGDLDVSIIDELPPGRKPIETRHIYDAYRQGLYKMLRREIDKGRQIYIVYPLIKESEKMDLKNLEEGFEQTKEAFPDCSVSIVHGKMKPAEKEAQMSLFASGQTQILVATSVIEVGVNVPNASVMAIENAERFGLSQLHQLRGRVGRGAEQSYCLLVTKYELSENTRKRLDIMCDTNDGFEIAEYDLKLRGYGDLEGTQQSGMAINLRIANLAKDGILLSMAREAAQLVIDNDPDCNALDNAMMWKKLNALSKKDKKWGDIS